MKLKYKSVTVTGEVHEGVLEAEDQYALARDLKAKGETLVTAEPAEKKTALAKFNTSFGSGVKLREKIIFAKNLAAMIDAGLSLSRGLAVMVRQTRNKRFKEILESIGNDVEKGQPLSVALAKFPKVFSGLFVSMVRAGEESGKLGDALRVVQDQMIRSFELTRKVRGAMMYPSIIMVVMILIGVLMLVYVVPTLTATFKEFDVDLPITTRFIIAVSDGLKEHIILFVIGVGVLVSGTITALRTAKGKRVFEWGMLHMPIIKDLVKQTNAARMARTFSSLLTSGVEVVMSISITRDVVQNSYYRDVLSEAEGLVQKGATLSSVFAEHERLYPPMVSEMISVGEETGAVPGMLLQIAEFFEGEVDQKTKNMSTIIEPFLMVFIGAAVGFFAVSMIMPIYSLSSSI